ncbi:MAG TPA: SRPBCC family protein, partial [Thermoanaerobaculia bacterium]
FMKNLDQVVDLGDGRSHWVGKSPLGLKVEWDAEIVDEQEGRRIAWRSLPGSQVHNAGTVWFDDSSNGRGTVVRVSMEIGGGIGQMVGKALGGVTEQQVREDLRRFKELMETGEIATTDGQPHGNRSLLGHIHNPI